MPQHNNRYRLPEHVDNHCPVFSLLAVKAVLMKRILHVMFCFGILALTATCHRTTVESDLPKAIPTNPMDAIVDAFATHSLVAIADDHGNEQVQAFRLSLLRDARVTSAFNDIVVEFGTAKYQQLMDDFTQGKDVPNAELRHAWQDTTQVEYDWDLPIYEEFFHSVRDLNGSLPQERKLRVILGDSPIDWGKVHSRSDIPLPLPGVRNAYVVGLIKDEVLMKGRRALIIYGTQHLIRKNANPKAPDDWAKGLVAQLERPGISKIFTIYPETHADLQIQQRDVSSWPVPSLAVLRGTTLGAALFWPNEGGRKVKMEDQFDAVLYLGPPSKMTMSQLPSSLCTDPEYMKMRLGRLALVPPPPGAVTTESEMLKSYCARVLRQK
jgi:hypothetical protein